MKSLLQWIGKPSNRLAATSLLGLASIGGYAIFRNKPEVIKGAQDSEVGFVDITTSQMAVPKDSSDSQAIENTQSKEQLLQQRFNEAKKYMDGKDYERNYDKAILILKELAEESYVPSYVELANIYSKGKGVRVSDKQAYDWYLKGAENGDTESQYNTGFLLMYGKNMPKDEQKAVEWMTKAAEKDYPHAHFKLGTIYLNGGDVVPKDVQKAHKYFTSAYELGVAPAAYFVGICEQLLSVRRDNPEDNQGTN